MSPRFLLAAAFAAGMFVGFLVRELPGFKLEPTANVADVGNLIVTLALAILLPSVITRKIDIRKRQLDRLSEHLRTMNTLVARAHEQFQAGLHTPLSHEVGQSIVSAFQRMSETLHVIRRLAERWNFSRTRMAQLDELGSALLAFKQIVTGKIPRKDYSPTESESRLAGERFKLLHTKLEYFLDDIV